MSHLFAYFSRLKFIRRWSLMRSAFPESVQEHSHRTALVAHALAMIQNRLFDGEVDPERVAVLALYHDAGEVLTGDLPSPIKYWNPEIREAYRGIESSATRRLLSMVPTELMDDYVGMLDPHDEDIEHLALVKAADKLCAYMKCLEETAAGSREFKEAEATLLEAVRSEGRPEVDYFLETFVPSLRLTLDELR